METHIQTQIHSHAHTHTMYMIVQYNIQRKLSKEQNVMIRIIQKHYFVLSILPRRISNKN